MDNRKISRRKFIIGGGLALLSAYWFFQVKTVAVTMYTVAIRDLPPSFQGFTILHLTDLHCKEYGKYQNRLLRLINKQNYDLVAITGDLVDKGNPYTGPAMDLVQGLSHKPVFFVPGNHEWWTGFTIKEQLLSRGVKVLENSSCKFFSGEDYIWLVGVDDPYSGRDNLGGALRGVGGKVPRILLTHAPTVYAEAVKLEIDLVMAGHTHGGQVRIPFVGAILVPGQGLFPELDYGLFSSGNTTMVINGGLGESMVPVRIFNRPEIVLITLNALGN